MFTFIVDMPGGATVDISQEEYDYMKENCGFMDEQAIEEGLKALRIAWF